MLDFILAISAGIGLSAACGFRVFVPPLMACLATHFGMAPVPANSWLHSDLALLLLGTAAALECAGYLFPWFDHLLDSAAIPAAAIAGMVMTGSLLGEQPELIRWALALIIGGGAATGVQLGTVAVRGASTASTGGAANPLVAIIEGISAFMLSVLAIVAPIFAALIALGLLIFIARKISAIRRWWRARRAAKLAAKA